MMPPSRTGLRCCMMISDDERREVAQKLRKQLRYMRENEMYEKDLDALEC